MSEKKTGGAEFLNLSMSLAAKLGAVVVHADELFSPDGHNVDKDALEALLNDPEVRRWIKSLGALAPVKRR